MRVVAALGVLALMLMGVSSCPRDPHPERTPSPAPTQEYPLQTGRQPAQTP